MRRTQVHRALVLAVLLIATGCDTLTPEARLDAAREALSKGELRTAEIHVRNALDDDADNVEALALFADVLLQAGDARGAEYSVRRALKLGADAASVQIALLRALLAQGKLDEVIAQAGAGAELVGDQRIAELLLVAAAQRGLGATADAEATYREALAIDAAHPMGNADLALLLSQLDRDEEAAELVAVVLRADATFVPALFVRGSLERKQGRNAEAETTFAEAVAQAEAGQAMGTDAYAAALTALIETQLSLGKLQEATTSSDKLIALQPRLTAARYLKALTDAENGRLAEAERRLDSLLVDLPEHWPAHRLLGAVKIRQKQPAQARMHLRVVVNAVPEDTEARLLLGELYIDAGDTESARNLFTDPAAARADPLFLALTGEVYRQTGEPEIAATYFEQSERRAPRDARELLALYSVYLNAGEFDRVVRTLNAAELQDPESERLKDYLLALSELRRGNLAAARQLAERLARDEPASAWPLNLQAAVALSDKDLDYARSTYSRALALEPNNVTTLLSSARIAVAEGRTVDAEELLRRVAAISSGEVLALYGLAQLAVQRRDYEEAAAWLARAPENAQRLRLEGEVFAAQRRYDLAADAFSRAFDKEPDADVAMLSFVASTQAGRERPERELLAWNRDHPRDVATNVALGSISLERGSLEQAVAHFESVVAEDPQHAGALNNLAWLLGERGDARAVAYGERARAADPSNPAIADTLGWLYVQAGDANRAMPLLDEARRGLPQDPEVVYHWAAALAETGEQHRALDALQRLVETAPSFPSRNAALARIRDLGGAAPR